MAERKRSKDGSRDTDRILGDEEADAPVEPGRQGGNLAREKATEDIMKRTREKPAGVTRVRKSDERQGGEEDEENKAG